MLTHPGGPPTYETPHLSGPTAVYETPLLLDVEEAASCDWGCVTSGDAAPAPVTVSTE
jgi:hypothetical protein